MDRARAAHRGRARRTTMRDVAQAAGVSLTTVSHALNGKGRVDADTREHVRAVAASLGFVPNRAARGLASGRTATLGLSLPRFDGISTDEILESDWYARVLVAAAQRALHSDHAVTILPAFSSVEELQRHPVDGVVVLEAAPADERLTVLADAGIPHVSTDRDPTRPDVLHVRSDAGSGIRALMRHLEAQGARAVLLLAAPVRLQSFDDTLATARSLSRPDFAVHQVVVDARHGGRSALYEAVRDATARALSAASPPDAVVGMFEGFGANIAAAAAAAGRAVPGDVLVAQDVDDVTARAAPPGITALDQQAPLQAHAAVDLLLDHIAGAPDLVPRVTPVLLRERASTARASQGGPRP